MQTNPTEPLCDRPPREDLYLDRRVLSSQKGGTLVAEEVMGLEAHERRLESVDGYRPERCNGCSGRRLHGHGLRVRVLAGDWLRLVEVRRYRCVDCRAVWQVLPGFVARRLWRRWHVVDDALRGKQTTGPPVAKRSQRRWRARLKSCGRHVRHVLGSTGRPEALAAVREVSVACTRGCVLAAYRQQMPQHSLGVLAAVLQRAAPGVRMV